MIASESTALNRDEAKIIKEIHEVCMAYLQQSRPVMLDVKKIKILFELMSCESADYILHKLNYDKVYHPIYLQELSYATLLSLTDAPPVLWYLFFVLTGLLFPLSIPVLMLHSWISRGTINLLKTDGSLLVEKITILCKEVDIRHTSQPYKVRPMQPYQLSTGAKYKNDKNILNEGSSGQVSVRQIEQTATPFETMTNALGQIANSAFQQMALYHLTNEVGLPVITSYRINPKEFEAPEQFSIDIRSKFRWTDAASMRIRIMLLTQFIMPRDFQAEGHKPLLLPKTPSAPENNRYNFFCLYKKNSLEAFIHQANNTQNIDEKENLLLQALSIAKNPYEQTKVLEVLVNNYGNYYEASNADFIRSHHTNSMLRDICMPRAERKMNEYASQLPLNFRSLATSAIQLDRDYQEICALTQRDIEEAWVKYQALPKLTPFIKRLFPNLVAMNYQLKIIFTLSRHLGSPSRGATKLGEFLPEHWIVEQVLSDFKKMLALIGSFDPSLKQQIKRGSIEPIQALIAAGESAKAQTPLAVSKDIRSQEALKTREFLQEPKNFTYRKFNENVDEDLEVLGTQHEFMLYTRA